MTTQVPTNVSAVAPAVDQPRKSRLFSGFVKHASMYVTMVLVSTIAIYCLEHAPLINAFRTALVAAIAKTIAATWVSGLFVD